MGFATFRGMLDITTPLQISLFAQMLNVRLAVQLALQLAMQLAV